MARMVPWCFTLKKRNGPWVLEASRVLDIVVVCFTARGYGLVTAVQTSTPLRPRLLGGVQSAC